MLWLGLILVVQVSILNPAFASDDICPPLEYLNELNKCVPCSTCKDGANKVVIRPCSEHADTVCGTIHNLTTQLSGFPRAKKRNDQLATKKTNSVDKWPAQQKHKATYQKIDDVSNTDYYEDGDRPSQVDIVQGAKKTNNDQFLRLVSKDLKSNYESDSSIRYLPSSIRTAVMSAEKLGFNKSGKHIKKDLSMSDSVKQPTENSTLSSATAEPVLNPTVAAQSKKVIKSKAKKNSINVNDHLVSIMDTKFIINGEEKNQPFSFVHPHVENHRIYLEMEDVVPADQSKASSTLFAAAKLNKRPPKPLILVKNNSTASKMAVSSPGENNSDLLQFHQLISGLAEALSNDSHEKANNESTRVATVDDNKNRILPKQSVHDDDYVADETDTDGEDDNDDDDSDEEDDDYDENEEDDDDDENEDYDADVSSNIKLLGGGKKTKNLSFGIGSSSHSLRPDDDDDEEDDDDLKLSEDDDDYGVIGEGKSSNKKWLQAETEVNMEPYSNSPDWQLLMLVSVVSVCLLFFVFVNIYICIYMKKWKHIKSNFEADVEDLSVRINLMQHGGLEIDDQCYIKNYITPLKSGRITEKSSKTSLREK